MILAIPPSTTTISTPSSRTHAVTPPDSKCCSGNGMILDHNHWTGWESTETTITAIYLKIFCAIVIPGFRFITLYVLKLNSVGIQVFQPGLNTRQSMETRADKPKRIPRSAHASHKGVDKRNGRTAFHSSKPSTFTIATLKHEERFHWFRDRNS